ncbi:hypothetical protein EV363DRAFT_1446605 [Boletus edulis]|nr:hypothetical protein EV363DRAFT_1446605 [Boletus edulis]
MATTLQLQIVPPPPPARRRRTTRMQPPRRHHHHHEVDNNNATRCPHHHGSGGLKGRGGIDGQDVEIPCPTRAPRETASGSNDPIVLDNSDLEEEEMPKKATQAKAQPSVPTSGPVYEVGVHAVKRLEAKILKNQARIKACEADMVDMSADVTGQSVELAAIKAALGM